MRAGASPQLGMILKGYPRISETFISNEIRLLEQSGVSLHLFSMRQPRESFVHDSVRQIRAKVDYLPEHFWRALPRFLFYNLPVLARKPGTYGKALCLAWKRFQRTRKTATLKHLLQAGYLVQRFWPKTRVVHWHAHFAHSPTSVAMFASLLSGQPFSFTAHAKDIYTSNPRQLAEKIEKARAVVTCTGYNQDYLKSLAPQSRTPIWRNYHGIDVQLFRPDRVSSQDPVRPNPARPNQFRLSPPFRILTVARLTAKKGLLTVFKALSILRERGFEIQYTLVGTGDQKGPLLDALDRFGLSPITRYLGTQSHAVVRGLYQQSHLFVIGCQVASNGDRDGIPNVLAESLAMALPAVATRLSGIPELIQSEHNGLLVEPRMPYQMAHAMARLLCDPKLRARLIANGRQQVQQNFDNRQLIQDLVPVMSDLVAQAAETKHA